MIQYNHGPPLGHAVRLLRCGTIDFFMIPEGFKSTMLMRLPTSTVGLLWIEGEFVPLGYACLRWGPLQGVVGCGNWRWVIFPDDRGLAV